MEQFAGLVRAETMHCKTRFILVDVVSRSVAFEHDTHTLNVEAVPIVQPIRDG
jgi:hypothetical protein